MKAGIHASIVSCQHVGLGALQVQLVYCITLTAKADVKGEEDCEVSEHALNASSVLDIIQSAFPCIAELAPPDDAVISGNRSTVTYSAQGPAASRWRRHPMAARGHGHTLPPRPAPTQHAVALGCPLSSRQRG